MRVFSCLPGFERGEPWPVKGVKPPKLSDLFVNGGGLGLVVVGFFFSEEGSKDGESE